MKSLEHKLIIYDSNCKVCSSLKDVVLRLTLIPDAKVKAYKDLNDELNAKIDPDKFRNVMALIDTAGGKTIYGSEGVAYILSSQYQVLNTLLSLRPVFRVFDFLYKTQAFNRYIIATPKSKFTCDCFPDRIVKYRMNYIILTFLDSIFLTAMFGLSIKHFVDHVSASEAIVQMLLMAGTGWVLQILIATTSMREKALDYIGHLGSIMVVGLLILVPWMLLYAFTRISNPYLPAISVAISSGSMLFLHIGRVRYLQLSQRWTVSWFILLQSTAFFWVYFFYVK
jgi:predicted DCC family thiol-disulfide oxidoreductase YuxK/flagellar biosynthesis protein FliQ